MIGAECTAIVSSRSVGFGMKAVALRPYRDVRFRGKSGKHLLVLSSSQFDPKPTSDDGLRQGAPSIVHHSPAAKC
jgi:hypothetical protein